MTDAPITPAPQLNDWHVDHLRRYLASNGADGHVWKSHRPEAPNPVTILLLTTTGRRTGKPFTFPLIYGAHGDSFVIVASKGGAPEHPGWYLNLQASPAVEVQVLARRFKARARTAAGEERAKLWKQMADFFPPYVEYKEKTGREIPLVVLDPQ
jgi:deazaflavin-dependent oxidoreductase (nitroreductase family)